MNIGEVTLWGMPIEVILIAWLVLANLCQSIGHWIEKSVWARERRELYSRIQAGTLRDYAAYTPLTAREQADNRQHTGDIVTSSAELSEPIRGLAEGDVIAGQRAYNDLMG